MKYFQIKYCLTILQTFISQFSNTKLWYFAEKCFLRLRNWLNIIYHNFLWRVYQTTQKHCVHLLPWVFFLYFDIRSNCWQFSRSHCARVFTFNEKQISALLSELCKQSQHECQKKGRRVKQFIKQWQFFLGRNESFYYSVVFTNFFRDKLRIKLGLFRDCICFKSLMDFFFSDIFMLLKIWRSYMNFKNWITVFDAF